MRRTRSRRPPRNNTKTISPDTCPYCGRGITGEATINVNHVVEYSCGECRDKARDAIEGMPGGGFVSFDLADD